MREVQALYKLNNCDNIVKIISHRNMVYTDAATKVKERVGCIFLEYISGETLAKTNISRLTSKQKFKIIKQLLSAIETAHYNGIIHRDINPNNIMIDDNGDVKVIDFGICKIKQMVNSATVFRMGTNSYSAPEVHLHSQNATEQSDLYSIGAVIYYLFTGEQPPVVTCFHSAIDKASGKGKAALKTRQRVDIQKTYLKDIIVDMITGVVYDADTVKVSNPHPRDVLLESVIKIDSSYLDSHFQEINSLYQLSLKNNSIFGNSSVTSELYKIIGISYSELHYAENRVYMYKSESSDELKFEFFLDDSDKYKNEFYTQMKEHCRPCQEYFFEKSRDFVNRIAGQPIKIEPSLIEQAEIARKMLFADNAADDTKTDIFTKKRYALNDREYMSYLYNSKVLKYKRIFVCSNHVNGLLSYSFCSQLNVLAEKIPVFLIYNKNEYGVEKTIRYFFKNPSSNLFLIASEEVDESIICFDSELAMYLQENAISAFERPVVYTMSTCDFDKKAVSKLSGMLIAKYNLAGYLSETSTQNNASPRKQKSNN